MNWCVGGVTFGPGWSIVSRVDLSSSCSNPCTATILWEHCILSHLSILLTRIVGSVFSCLWIDSSKSLCDSFKAVSLLEPIYLLRQPGPWQYSCFEYLRNCSRYVISINRLLIPTENIHGIPFWRLVHILQSCKDLKYRNPALLTAAGNHVASMLCVWEVKQVRHFLELS